MIIHARSSKRKVKNKPGHKLMKQEYEHWLKKHEPKKVIVSKNTFKYDLSIPAERDTKHIPSVNSTGFVSMSKKSAKVYTGDKMLGIGTLHKSNAVPVFSSDEAKEMSQMRR